MASWFSRALAEPDGTPSTSRLVAFAWAAGLLSVFICTALLESSRTGLMPNVEHWSSFLGWAQVGGAVPYIVNQARRAVNGGKP